MSIKLTLDDYCQECPCFEVEVHDNCYCIGFDKVANFEVVCANAYKCRLIRGYQKRILKEATNGSLSNARKNS